MLSHKRPAILTVWPVPTVSCTWSGVTPLVTNSPGGPFILQSLIWYKLDGPAQALAYLADAQMKLMGFTLL